MKKTLTRAFLIAGCLPLLVISLFVLKLDADEWDKKTIITTNQPIAIPGMILPAGKYALRLMDSPSNRHIVQFLSGDEMKLYNTVLAIPDWRSEPTDDPLFTFYESEPGHAPALRSWFYAGSNNGVGFVYPQEHVTSTASDTGREIPVAQQPELDESRNEEIAVEQAPIEESPIRQSEPNGDPAEEEFELAQSTPPATSLPSRQTPETTQEVQQPSTELPRTASPQAFLLLFGMGSAAAAFAMRLKRQ